MKSLYLLRKETPVKSDSIYMPDRSRIPKDIKDFVPYIQSTDDYQKAIDSATGNPRYKNWKWTNSQSAKWTLLRNKVDEENETHREKVRRSSHSTTAILLLRKELVKYNRREKLLARIAITGLPTATLHDFEVFRIKQGTPLEQKPSFAEANLRPPVLHVRSIENLTHHLKVRNPAHAGWGKGDKIKSIEMWRAIVDADVREPIESDYKFIGHVNHGSFKSEFMQNQRRKDAFYKSRKVSSRGTRGRFSRPLRLPIV